MDAHKNAEGQGAEVDAPLAAAPEEGARKNRIENGSEAKGSAAHAHATTGSAKAKATAPKAEKPEKGSDKRKNNVRKLRTERMMSKAELARRAGISVLTVDRVERGMSCRMDTKRKILEALGLKPQDRVMVFGDAEDD
jgi:ribosome-binding protein aMBF1 (putative translation factor)